MWRSVVVLVFSLFNRGQLSSKSQHVAVCYGMEEVMGKQQRRVIDLLPAPQPCQVQQWEMSAHG